MRRPADFTKRMFERWTPDIWPRSFSPFDLARLPAQMFADAQDAWLDSLGGVSKARYQKLLEENLELRRRLEKFECAPGAEAAAEAVDQAFDQFRSMQEQWLSMWRPHRGADAPKK